MLWFGTQPIIRSIAPICDSDNVSVIDGATNRVIATIPVGDGPRAFGLELNPEPNLCGKL